MKTKHTRCVCGAEINTEVRRGKPAVTCGGSTCRTLHKWLAQHPDDTCAVCTEPLAREWPGGSVQAGEDLTYDTFPGMPVCSGEHAVMWSFVLHMAERRHAIVKPVKAPRRTECAVCHSPVNQDYRTGRPELTCSPECKAVRDGLLKDEGHQRALDQLWIKLADAEVSWDEFQDRGFSVEMPLPRSRDDLDPARYGGWDSDTFLAEHGRAGADVGWTGHGTKGSDGPVDPAIGSMRSIKDLEAEQLAAEAARSSRPLVLIPVPSQPFEALAGSRTCPDCEVSMVVDSMADRMHWLRCEAQALPA